MKRVIINKLATFLARTIGIPSFQKEIQEIRNAQIQQKHLQFYYQHLSLQNLPLPKFSDVGFRVFSQTDEDGILHFLFSVIGTTNKICLDIAFASPYGANTTNLIVNNGWNGILICGGVEESENVKNFFLSHPDTHIYPPKVYQQWITAENINDTVYKGLGDLHVQEEKIDMLSLDIDGMEYWIWKGLDIVEPRVVVVEYQDIWGEKSVTAPYKPLFNRFDTHPDYYGASLPALVKLAKHKGYRLVGCNRYGYNAFFIKNGIAEDMIPEIPVQDCLKHPKVRDGQKNRLPAVERLEWVEI